MTFLISKSFIFPFDLIILIPSSQLDPLIVSLFMVNFEFKIFKHPVIFFSSITEFANLLFTSLKETFINFKILSS